MNKKVLEIMADIYADGGDRRVAILALTVLISHGGTMRHADLFDAMDRLWVPVLQRLAAIRYLEQHGHTERAMRDGHQTIVVTP